MRATQFKRQVAAIFTTAKCSVAIPVPGSLLRDALILAALDPAVRSIEFLPHADLPQPALALNGLVLNRDDGCFFLNVEDPEAFRDPGDEETLLQVLEARGITHTKMSSEYLRREPRLSNSREVWRHSRHRVPFADRLQIMGCLAEDGPQSIFELEDRINPTSDVGSSICALACADLLELELTERTLGPRTVVRERH
jgi:hypothetical protein